MCMYKAERKAKPSSKAERPRDPRRIPSSTMVTESAFFGQPPANERDRLIVIGLTLYNTLPNVPPNLTGAEGLPTTTSPNPRLFDSHAGRIIAGSTVSFLIILIITGIRVITKFRSKRSTLGWDDWLITFAAFASVGYSCIVIDQVRRGGVGKHEYNVTYAEVENRAASNGISSWFTFFVTVPAKLSVVCFNARLTGLTSKFWKWVHRVFFVLLCAYGLFYIPWNAFSFSPTSAFYSYITLATAENPSLNHSIPQSLNVPPVIIHIVSDWLLLAIPIYLVMRLNMSLVKKLRCILPISVGCLSAIGATLSIRTPPAHIKDLNLNADIMLGYSNLDMVCCIIATSLPTVAFVVERHVKLWVPSSWQRYFSADRELPPYESNPSNPFGSNHAKDEDQSDLENGRTLRNPSNEDVEIGDQRKWINVDVASHRFSGLWVIGSKRGSRSDGGQWPLKS